MKLLISNATTSTYLLGEDSDQEVTINLVITNSIISEISICPIVGEFDQIIDAKGLHAYALGSGRFTGT